MTNIDEMSTAVEAMQRAHGDLDVATGIYRAFGRIATRSQVSRLVIAAHTLDAAIIPGVRLTRRQTVEVSAARLHYRRLLIQQAVR